MYVGYPYPDLIIRMVPMMVMVTLVVAVTMVMVMCIGIIGVYAGFELWVVCGLCVVIVL